MTDELKKRGLRLRPRKVGAQAQGAPGKISFDERGNAVYEWQSDRLAQDGEHADRLRGRALDHPGLSLLDEEPPANAPVRPNPKGLRVGYNPYESGLLAKKEWKKKRDLRALSNWIETKRKLHERPPDED